ncbi:hypothetical protein N0V95_009913 [Ascochyta clinopodiicola]|nr:hypothetical protein N0V95_009913 [Ascochyta clinopodiicola]
MEDNTVPRISPESFVKFSDDDRCRVSRSRVQDFLDRGLMSQGDTIFENSTDLSKDLLKQWITERISKSAVNVPQPLSTVLFDIIAFHAFYPFPIILGSEQQVQVDQDGFVRAICLLTLSPAPRYGPNSSFSAARHGRYSGTWGPYCGWYIALRGRDASDFRRRIFRCLATPLLTPGESRPVGGARCTMIEVPRFAYYEEVPQDEGEEEEVPEIIVVEGEKETEVDVVDVLSECPPEVDRLTANPFRESYRLVLPSLPRSSEDLTELGVTTEKLVALVQLHEKVQKEGTERLVCQIQSAGRDGMIGWLEFERLFVGNSEFLAEGLSSISGTFAERRHEDLIYRTTQIGKSIVI